ncbi:hypothetical protein [Streptomyces sp. NPDC092129]|uniref:hypothetical protein n=1 Tax=Streptomyces sp. NPDC092129 TaxID=3366010 RepID=UPI0038082382
MALSPRFALNTLSVVAGGFLTVSTLAFSAPVAGWLGFGISAGVALAAAVSTLGARRTAVRLAHGGLTLVALWSLTAALVFSGTALTWLVFADALAMAAVALGDLTAHEVSTERVVHALEVRNVPAPAAPSAVIHDVAA